MSGDVLKESLFSYITGGGNHNVCRLNLSAPLRLLLHLLDIVVVFIVLLDCMVIMFCCPSTGLSIVDHICVYKFIEIKLAC